MNFYFFLRTQDIDMNFSVLLQCNKTVHVSLINKTGLKNQTVKQESSLFHQIFTIFLS